MADYEARIAPFINQIFYITSVWWEEPRNHRGLDIATPTSVGNFPVCSMCDGTVIFSGAQTDGQGNYAGYGNYIIVKDNTTNMGFLFAHLERRDVAVGDQVLIGEQIGLEGTTGDSTGIHLHLEMQDLTNHNWIYGAPKEVYTNPADFMGIPNVEGISVIYYGTPIPPEPVEKIRKKFNWIFFKKARQRRDLMI